MELLAAMLVILIITGAATMLLVGAFNVRGREDARSEGIADARRALHAITRELANSGYQLPGGLTFTSSVGTGVVPSNGLIPTDCGAQSITFVANLNSNGAGGGDTDVTDPDEAIKFEFVQQDGKHLLARSDLSAGGETLVLANGLDGVQFEYLDAAGADTSADLTQAVRVRLTFWVTLKQRGSPGTPNYQAPSQVRLSSAVNLRNANLGTF